MAVLYFSSSPLRAEKGKGTKGHSCRHFMARLGGWSRGKARNGLTVCQQMQLGKEDALKDLCNLKSKINDVPIWKGKKKMEVKFNKGWLKRDSGSKGLSLQLGSSQEK